MRNDGGHARGEAYRPFTLIGVPGSRRTLAIVQAARELGIGPIDVVSYLDWIEGRWIAPRPESLVRIDSPSGCDETTRAMLRAGIAPLESAGGAPISDGEVERLAFDRGEMLHPRQWYYGFRELLRRLELVGESASVSWMSHPAAIVTAFDKLACLEAWGADDLPVPRRFAGLSTYAAIREAIDKTHARLFVKLRYGYAAMGAVALEWRGALVRAITTMEVTSLAGRARLFVSKRPQVLTRESEIAWLIDTLGREEILVEEWLPKARWNGKPYDVRVVMIGGRPRHMVGRAHASPFTNLNLDATRISHGELEDELGDSWPLLSSLCERAAAGIARAGVLGLDVLIRPCRQRFALLEANAFGDYLPGLLEQGESTYVAELRHFCAAEAGALA